MATGTDNTERLAQVRERIRTLLDTEEVKSSELAKQAGVSTSALSQFMADKYTGNNDAVADKLEAWLETRNNRQAVVQNLMDEPDFVETGTAKRIRTAIQYAHFTNDIAVIYGGAGIGKTQTFRHYRDENAGVYLITVTPAHTTVRHVLQEIAKTMGIGMPRDNVSLAAQVCVEIRQREGMLIFDESQHLNAKCIDQLRQIHDDTKCGIVFAGNETVYTNISGGRSAAYLDRLFSRVGTWRNLKKSTKADAEALVAAWGITEAASVKLLCDAATKPGGLREIVKTLKYARMLAGEPVPGAAHIKAAHKQRTGGGQ